MKQTLAVLILATTAPLGAQTINKGGIVNAASQALQGLPNSPIAQGSIFLINGTDLGTSAQAESPLDVTLAGTTVNVTVGGTTLPAPVVSTSPTQVTAIMPSGIPTGTGTVTVNNGTGTSPAAAVQVTSAAFGIYTLNNAGSGPAQATDANGNPVTVANVVQPGASITISGTGLGALAADDLNPPAMQDISPSVTVYVGVEQVPASYAGRAGTSPGRDQITFTIPADAITGCNVPVAVVINNTPSNFATLAVSSGTACSDLNGFSADQIAQLQQALSGGNTLRLGSISVGRSATTIPISLPPGLPPGIPLPSPTTTTDNGSAGFFLYTPDQVAGSLSALNTPSIGGCLLFNGNSPNAVIGTLPQGLDAGPSIGVSGAKGAKQLMPTQGFPGTYGAQLGTSTAGGQLYLDPGTFNFSGTGGADVGAFQTSIQVPPALAWPSPPTNVVRANGVTVNWTGGAAGTFVIIIGISTGAGANGQNAPAGFFICEAPANAGTFTVPPVVTLSLPATAPASGQVPIPNGFMSIANSATQSFTAPGIDIGVLAASSSVMQPVSFQ